MKRMKWKSQHLCDSGAKSIRGRSNDTIISYRRAVIIMGGKLEPVYMSDASLI